MTEAVAERPSWRISFRWLIAVALGLAMAAFVGGRHIYKTYADYRRMALVHVPQTMRYRARVDLNDDKRLPALAPLLQALDPRGVRLPALKKRLLGAVPREVAFGVGAEPSDFVLVLGLQLQAGTGLPPAHSLCEVLSEDGIRSEPTPLGCRFAAGGMAGGVVAGTPEGAVVLASRAELVKDLLERPDIGDRLGFSGPSVRGTAPEPRELAREAQALAGAIAAKYP